MTPVIVANAASIPASFVTRAYRGTEERRRSIPAAWVVAQHARYVPAAAASPCAAFRSSKNPCYPSTARISTIRLTSSSSAT